MKEISKVENIKIYNGEIEVKPYLSYAEIQAICNAVCEFDSWSERQENVDILLLHFASSLTDEDIEKYGHESLLESGIIDDVKRNVRNFNRIEEAISYTQSMQKVLLQVVNGLYDAMDRVEKNGGKKQ